MSIDKDTFRKTMGCFAAGVTVVTSVDAEGRPFGLTATAFSSVSADPPLALVCIGKESSTHAQFAAAGVFVVNFLSIDQADVSQRFASSGVDKFAGLEYATGELGAPVLAGTIGFAECRVVHVYEGGDHTIFVGQIEAGSANEALPLTYFRGAYRSVSEPL